jgi:hypothetical protein
MLGMDVAYLTFGMTVLRAARKPDDGSNAPVPGPTTEHPTSSTDGKEWD